MSNIRLMALFLSGAALVACGGGGGNGAAQSGASYFRPRWWGAPVAPSEDVSTDGGLS